MRVTLGILLVLIGAAVMLYGIGGALLELIDLYRGALNDPIGNAELDEKATSGAMIRFAVIGAAGIPPFVIGGLLLKITMLQRLARARRR